MNIETFHNAIPDHLRRAAEAEFPDAGWSWYHQYANGKLATVDPYRIPSACHMALQELARTVEPPEGSFWDMDLYGAGLHLMTAGSDLGWHRDAEYHPRKPWKRIASLVYFIHGCEGGALEIKDSDRVTRVTPHTNTAVVLPSQMLHRVEPVLTSRRTLSLFAWQVDSSEKTTTQAQFTEPGSS